MVRSNHDIYMQFVQQSKDKGLPNRSTAEYVAAARIASLLTGTTTSHTEALLVPDATMAETCLFGALT